MTNTGLLTDSSKVWFWNSFHKLQEITKWASIHVLQDNGDDTIVIKALVAYNYIMALSWQVYPEFLSNPPAYSVLNVQFDNLNFEIYISNHQERIKWTKHISSSNRNIKVCSMFNSDTSARKQGTVQTREMKSITKCIFVTWNGSFISQKNFARQHLQTNSVNK